jgi:hypothetical protein
MNSFNSNTLICDLIMCSKDMTISPTSNTLWNLIPIIYQNYSIPTFKFSFALNRACDWFYNHLFFPLWIIFLLSSFLLTLRACRSWPRLSIFFWIVLFLFLIIWFDYTLIFCVRWYLCLICFCLFISTGGRFWSFNYFLRTLISFIVWGLLLSELILFIVHIKVLLLLGCSIVLLLHLSKNSCLMMKVLWTILSFRSTWGTSWNRHPWYWTRDKRRHTKKSRISLRKHLMKMLSL